MSSLSKWGRRNVYIKIFMMRFLWIFCPFWKMDYFPDPMLQQGLRKPFVVIIPSLLNKFWSIFKLVLVQMSCFIGWVSNMVLQHPNIFKIQILKLFVENSCMQEMKCIYYRNIKFNSEAKELKLNVVSVKLTQYLICN